MRGAGGFGPQQLQTPTGFSQLHEICFSKDCCSRLRRRVHRDDGNVTVRLFQPAGFRRSDE